MKFPLSDKFIVTFQIKGIFSDLLRQKSIMRTILRCILFFFLVLIKAEVMLLQLFEICEVKK